MTLRTMLYTSLSIMLVVVQHVSTRVLRSHVIASHSYVRPRVVLWSNTTRSSVVLLGQEVDMLKKIWEDPPPNLGIQKANPLVSGKHTGIRRQQVL